MSVGGMATQNCPEEWTIVWMCACVYVHEQGAVWCSNQGVSCFELWIHCNPYQDYVVTEDE